MLTLNPVSFCCITPPKRQNNLLRLKAIMKRVSRDWGIIMATFAAWLHNLCKTNKGPICGWFTGTRPVGMIQNDGCVWVNRWDLMLAQMCALLRRVREPEGGYSVSQRHKVLLLSSTSVLALTVGELRVHRSVVNLLRSKHIAHALLCRLECQLGRLCTSWDILSSLISSFVTLVHPTRVPKVSPN